MTDLIEADNPPRDGRDVHSAAVWDYARRDYLDGESAAKVCARYGIARSTFWDHAAAGGWRRRDQPPPDLPPLVIAGEPDQPLEYWDMIEIIHERLGKAVANGRAAEVSAWLRVLQQFEKPVQDLVEMCREERSYRAQDRTGRPDTSDMAT